MALKGKITRQVGENKALKETYEYVKKRINACRKGLDNSL